MSLNNSVELNFQTEFYETYNQIMWDENKQSYEGLSGQPIRS